MMNSSTGSGKKGGTGSGGPGQASLGKPELKSRTNPMAKVWIGFFNECTDFDGI